MSLIDATESKEEKREVEAPRIKYSIRVYKPHSQCYDWIIHERMPNGSVLSCKMIIGPSRDPITCEDAYDSMKSQLRDLCPKLRGLCFLGNTVRNLQHRILHEIADLDEDADRNTVGMIFDKANRYDQLYGFLKDWALPMLHHVELLGKQMLKFLPLIRKWRLDQLHELELCTRIPEEIIFTNIASMIGVVPDFTVRPEPKTRKRRREHEEHQRPRSTRAAAISATKRIKRISGFE